MVSGLLSPISGHRISQGFAGRHEFEPAGFLSVDLRGPRRARFREFSNSIALPRLHGALDIKCAVGTKVVAPERGRIVAAGTYKDTGERFMMLQIRRGTVLFFTHLDSFTKQKDDVVDRGVEIARSGNTGKSTGPHLHWEVRVTTNPQPNVHRSRHWFKWNPRRLLVGRDLAAFPAILPPGVAPTAMSSIDAVGAVALAEAVALEEAAMVAQAADVDEDALAEEEALVAESAGAALVDEVGFAAAQLDPDDDVTDESGLPDDDFGDAALAAELGIPVA